MQYTYSEEPLVENDQSENGNVFAYLLQTTAHIRGQHQNEHDQQQFAFAVGQKDGEWMSVHHDSCPSSIPPITPFSKPYGVESLVSPGIEYHGSEGFLSDSLFDRHRRIHLS